jgi:hypothetical protein
VSINVPRNLYEEAVKKGIDLEDLIVIVLAKILRLDPNAVAKAHLELAEKKFLGEGRDLVSKDPI